MRRPAVLRICLLFKHNNRSDRERLSGVCRFAATRPDWDIRTLDRSSPQFAAEAAKMSRGWTPDGVIYTADAAASKALRRIGIRQICRAAMDPPDTTSAADADVDVRANARAILSEVATFLRRRGFASFGFYGTEAPDERDYSNLCERHFIAALRKRSLPVSVFREPFAATWSRRIQAAADWMASLNKPCAVLAYSDELARNLLDASRAARINVPEQVSILGIDDAPDICETCRPTLSSVRLDFEMSGFLAAKALDSVIRSGHRGRCRRFSYGIRSITERQSTQDVCGCGRIVTRATECIRTLSLDELSVSTILEHVRVSRRTLETSFRKVIGHGVHAEIQRRRLETLHDQLTTTSRPIGELALICGFRSDAAARIAFRKRYGTTMTAVRKGRQN